MMGAEMLLLDPDLRDRLVALLRDASSVMRSDQFGEAAPEAEAWQARRDALVAELLRCGEANPT